MRPRPRRLADFGRAIAILAVAITLHAGAVRADPTLEKASADELIVVDCRLPPKVRKLGTSMVYQVPGQVLRLPAQDCEVRGGEYTILDPSRTADAIKFWMPDADKGDAKAETNVGTLYEKSEPPDYAAAASWYGKAAALNYGPAEVALGHLYESGRGVPRDVAKALNLYRQAAGITGGTLELVTSAEPTSDAGGSASPETEQLKQELQRAQQELQRLRQQRAPRRTDAAPSGSANSPSLAKQEAADQQSIEKRKSALKADSARLATLPAPSVEIVYPLATRGGNRLNISIRGGGSATQIIGRVISPLGVDHVSADGKPILFDDQNLFIIPQADVAGKKAIRVEVTDFLGRSSNVDITLASAAPSGSGNAGSGPSGEVGLGNFYALIIGDGDFLHWEKLQNAVPDAQAIEQVLRTRYGFKTTLLTNATRKDILSAFNDLRQVVGPNDNLLVYYAGHGELVQKVDRGYWIPIDADTTRDTEWILNEQITDYLEIIPARRILVIADSCYSGVLTRSSIERPKSDLEGDLRLTALKELARKRVRTVMTSGGVQPVLDEGADGHSVFANALLKVLQGNQDIMEANRLFEAISPQVTTASSALGYTQTPTYKAIAFAGHEGGDFIFVPSEVH